MVQPKLRLDKWLFHARFFRTRAVATEVVEEGHCRINSQRCGKPGHGVAVGDVLTFPQGDRIRVVRVLGVGERRGPATEAQRLYDDLDATSSDLE
ncbi:MAG: RNA-binding S4 domain-containing protein [Paracoccaceae bacterium]